MKKPVIEIWEYPDGTKGWFRDGEWHREDGPAIEWADGTKMWYRDDKLHREDGPAIEYPDGYKAWYRDGQRIPSPAATETEQPTPAGEFNAVAGLKQKLLELEQRVARMEKQRIGGAGPAAPGTCPHAM
jgi:hypothetical protein